MKYSANFERDFKWFLSMRHTYTFDGSLEYYNKKGEKIIQYSKNGVSGKRAFFAWDSQGKILPTKHPLLLFTLLKVKGSVNLHIKMYAEDRAKGYLPGAEFEQICFEQSVPEWFYEAVENQKSKYIPKDASTIYNKRIKEMHCKYCKEELDDDVESHDCSKKGLLNVHKDDSFLVSALIANATDSALMGGLLGGDMAGGILGDVLDGDLFD